MSITISKRPSLGGGVIFQSETATRVREAIAQMGSRPDLYGASLYCANLRNANLCRANLRDANLCDAYLRGAILSWESHSLLSEILRQAAGGDWQRRSIAGLVAVSTDWCWPTLLALEIPADLRDWALGALAAYAWADDSDVSSGLLAWMQQTGIERHVRPTVEDGAKAEEVS